MFLPQSIEKYIRQLESLDSLDASIFILRADDGHGKTSFLHTLTEKLPEESIARKLDLRGKSKLREFYVELNQQFHGEELVGDIEPNEFLEMFETQIPDGRTYLLLIDDADKLTPEILEALVKLIIVSNSQVKALVAVQKDFDFHQALGQVWRVAENRSSEFQIEAFNDRQAKAFLSYLSIETNLSVSEEQALEIIEASHGNPGLIKDAFLEAEHVAFNESQSLVFDDGEDPDPDSAYYDDEDYDEDEDEDEVVEESQNEKPSLLANLPIPHLIGGLVLLVGLYFLLSMETEEIDEAGQRTTQINLGYEEKEGKSGEIDNQVDKSEDLDKSLSIKSEEEVAEDTEEIQGVITTASVEAEVKSERLSVSERLALELQEMEESDNNDGEIAVEEKPVEKAPEVKSSISKSKVEQKPSKPEKKVETLPVIKSTQSVDWSPYQSAYWLRGLNPNNYTLQLMGSHDDRGVRQFLKDNGVSSKYAVYTGKKDGKPWHVIVYGVYENREFASEAKENLPPYLSKHKPWIRSLKDVQNSIE